MKRKKREQRFPRGWNEKRVQEVIAHYSKPKTKQRLRLNKLKIVYLSEMLINLNMAVLVISVDSVIHPAG